MPTEGWLALHAASGAVPGRSTRSLGCMPAEDAQARGPGSLSADFLRTVGRHFVTLSCVQAARGKESVLVFSGFVVEVCGVWMYVTAGHILRDLKAALAAGGQFSTWRLDDQSAGNKFKGMAIPFEFDIVRWLVLEDRETGLDYAVLVLDTMYRLPLAAGGIVAIDKAAWGDYTTEFDHWAGVGIPSESVGYDGETIIRARIIVAPLEPADSPAQAGRRAENQFYARLKGDPTGHVKDLDGMSGGPIFALKRIEGEWRYTVIGVHSGWYRNERIVTACPFSSLGYALEEVVRPLLPDGACEERHAT